MTSHSLPKILSKVTQIQSQMKLPAIQRASRSGSAFQELHDQLHQQVSFLAQGIDRDLMARDLSAADLAIRSRRAFQWLKFLSDPSRLSTHLDFLQRVNLYLAQWNGAGPEKYDLSLYNQSAYYRISPKKDLMEVKIQESFFSAPDRFIGAVLELSRNPSSRQLRTALRNYTFSVEFRKNREHLEYLGVPRGSLAKGIVHDLVASFQRVNRDYFQGRINPPHLVWNNRLTHRKFGHYQWDIDTIMVSRSLDQRRVPELVIDFVIYHELLHKVLGLKLAKQNRIAHTREFRAKEDLFNGAEKARQQLNRIARKRRRSSS